MFAQVHFPETLSPGELDHYLEQGWFRMGQTIFTTNFLNFKQQLYSAVWLRTSLREFIPSKTQQKIAKLNDIFRIEIQKATITPEKETLFATYKRSVPFEASASLQQLLFGKALHNIYDTQEISLYDGNRLIAIGYFDMGAKSAAGISSFYDPAYKKYSLGKYLIFLKMSYCKSQRLQYFYPGYFVPGYKAFDYKLEMSKPALQYFKLSIEQWVSIKDFIQENSPLQVMTEKLNVVQNLITGTSRKLHFLHYEFFDANLIPDLKGMELFDFPVFLNVENYENNIIIVVYDVRDQYYYVFKCISVWEPNLPQETLGFYNAHLLRIEDEFFASTNPKEIVAFLLSSNN